MQPIPKIQRRLREMLKVRFADIRSRNSAFTMRSFAKKLRLSPGALSEIMNGRRSVSLALARRIVGNFGIVEFERSKMLNELTEIALLARGHVQAEFKILRDDWRYAAILCFFELEKPVTNPTDIAGRLGINVTLAIKLMSDLAAKNLLAVDSRGDYSLGLRPWTMKTEITEPSLAKLQMKNFQNSLAALGKSDADEQVFGYLTFSGNSKTSSRARREINRSLNKVEQIFGAGPADSVYVIGVQLFPIANKKEGDTN